MVKTTTASEGRNEMGFVVRDENVTSWFEINTSDGRIRVVRQMDREKAETIRLAIRAEDVAAATTGQTASGSLSIKAPCWRLQLDSTRQQHHYVIIFRLYTGTLTIILEDINDHDPIFNQPFYRRSVPENSKRGATILTLSADDADLNRSVTYSLDGIFQHLQILLLKPDNEF